MARSSSSSRPTRSRSKESLSDKLSSSMRRSTRKRSSLTSETSLTTADSSTNAMPPGADVVLATPISPQEPFGKKKVTPEELNKSRRRQRSSRDKKKLVDRNRSFSSSSVTNFDRVEWDNELSESQATNSDRRRRRRRSTERPCNKSSSKLMHTPPTRADSHYHPKSMPSSSRRTSRSRERSRRSSSARKNTPSALSSPDAAARSSSRKRVSISEKNSRRSRERTSSIKPKFKSKPKPRRCKSHHEQSLTSFMQKEFSKRPEETGEALEVKSAYTSMSRARKRNKKPLILEEDSMSASYHGDSARRNTRTFREMMAAKAAQAEEEEDDLLESSFRRSLSGELYREGTRSDDLGASLQLNYHQRARSDDLGASLQLHHHQSFGNLDLLPVLPEESKKKTKIKSFKSRNKSRKSSKKHNSSISPQELSDFLEKCNAKRKRKQEKEAKNNNKVHMSSPSGDRSCVSMPALTQSNNRNKFSPDLLKMSKQRSQRSLYNTDSDSDNKGPLIEKLGDKGRHQARSRSTRLSRGDRSNSSNHLLEEGTRNKPSRPRSRSANKEGSLSSSRREQNKEQSQTHRHHHQSPPSNKTIRSKGFQKLFSIRDLKSVEGDAVAPAPLVFRREDASSAWAPRTPSNSQRTGHGVPASPPPPLAPHSPVTGLRSDDEGSASWRNRRASASAADLANGARSVEDDESEQRILLAKNERRHSSYTQQPTSILKNKMEPQLGQIGGDDTEERERPVDSCLDYEETLEYEAEMGIEEDVFSHYTWTNDERQDLQEMREERRHLKESIRESVLYTAFEAFNLQSTSES